MDPGDRVYDDIREGIHSVGETHMLHTNHSMGRTSPTPNKSTVKDVALDTITDPVRQNASAQAPEPAVCPTLVVPDDYSPDGEGPRTGSAESHVVRSPKSLEKPQEERVLILAANSGGSCSLRLGDYYNFLSLLDKLQYGNVHGYDVLLGMGNVDDDLRKTWNKVAWMQKVCYFHACMPFCSSTMFLCFLHLRSVFSHAYKTCENACLMMKRLAAIGKCSPSCSSKQTCSLHLQAVNETAREDAEWILWMDLDTVAVESDIAFPLADYEGKDLVLWIQPDLVMQGDAFRKSSS